MFDDLLERIDNINSFDEILDILDDVYKIDNVVNRNKLISKLQDLSQSFKKKSIFDKTLKDIEIENKINSNKHTCVPSNILPDIFEYDKHIGIDNFELDTGEFKVDNTGIYDKNGILVCSTVIFPYCLYLKNVDNVEKVRVIYLKKDKWEFLDIDRSTVASQNKIIDLANHGISVNSGNSLMMVKYFSTIFDNNIENIPVKNSVGKLGWVDNNTHFIPYNSKNYDFVLSVNSNALSGSKQIYDAICEKGDYDTWFDCMKKMRTNIPTRLAFGASAISPLLTILGTPCFVTMLYGKTGTGKTLSCRCAVSMWGDPNVLSTRADSTTAAITRKCLFFNNFPFFVDEFQLLKGDDSQNFLMSVTEGVQKTKAEMNSSNNFTSSSSWKNCTLITGEKQCVQSNTGGGAVNRIIELRIDDMVADEMQLQDIYYKIDENYGFFGKKLMDLYMDKDFQKKIKKRFIEIQDTWRDLLDTQSKQLIAISCLVLGDEILREYFFHDEEEITVDMIRQFVASKDSISYSERVYNDVCDLIIANRGRFIVDTVPSSNTGKADSLEIWGSICKSDPTTYYIIPKILRSELKKRDGTFLDNTILEDWKNKGYIKCTYKNGTFERYEKKASVNGAKPWCFVFKGPAPDEIMNSEEE